VADQEMQEKVKKLLREIVEIDEFQRISSDASRVVVETPAIRRITAQGPSILDVLISAMKEDMITFDAFVRCYSACDQILLKAGSSERVWWLGNNDEELDGRWNRFLPGRIKDVKAFRDKVIGDIITKRKLLDSGKGDGKSKGRAAVMTQEFDRVVAGKRVVDVMEKYNFDYEDFSFLDEPPGKLRHISFRNLGIAPKGDVS
jgi:hypothetical protein